MWADKQTRDARERRAIHLHRYLCAHIRVNHTLRHSTTRLETCRRVSHGQKTAIDMWSERRRRLALSAACLLYPEIFTTIAKRAARVFVTEPHDVTDMRMCLDFMNADTQQ
jgi:hypothetical protein